jgi:hypothetical protein
MIQKAVSIDDGCNFAAIVERGPVIAFEIDITPLINTLVRDWWGVMRIDGHFDRPPSLNTQNKDTNMI